MDAADRDYLIRTVIGEAANEPETGQAAVAHVVLNRLASGKWGDNARSVVLAPSQFEPWGTRRNELLGIDPNSPAYQSAARIVDGVLTGQIADPTGGMTHFLNPEVTRQRFGSVPRWAQGQAIRIGQHDFYAPEGFVSRPETALDAINKAAPVASDLSGAGVQPLAFNETTKAPAMPQPAPAASSDDDILKLYTKKGVQVPAAASSGPISDDDILKLYTKPESAPAAPVEAPKAAQPGLLANAPGDGELTALGKNIATGAVKGVGNAAGFVSNTKGLADYLLGRADSAVTGRPVGEVMADQKAIDERIANDNPTLIGRIRNAISPTNVLPSAQTVQNWLLAKTGAYTPESEPGRLLQGGVDAVVSSLGPGVRGAPSGVPMAAPVATIARQAPGIAASAAAGQYVTDATGDPLLGMAASALPAVGAGAARYVGNKLIGTVDPNTAALADTARNRFEIPLNTGQMSESPFVRFLNSTVNRLPFSGAGENTANQAQAFNRAVSKTFGEDAGKLVPQVMAQARNRIGQSFEDAAARTSAIAADPVFQQNLAQIVQNAAGNLTPGELAPVFNQVQNVINTFRKNGGQISGVEYQNMTKAGTPLASAMKNSNPNIKNAAIAIREALDDAFERSAPPDVAAQLQQARGQWKAMRTVEDLVAKSPTGDISPALLQSKVNAANKGTYGAAYGGGGDLKTLSDIGQRFMKEPPSSGTAERSSIIALLSSLGAGISGGMATGNPIYGAYSAAVPIGAMAAGRATGNVLRSEALANALLNRSLGRPQAPGLGNKLINLAAPSILNAGSLAAR